MQENIVGMAGIAATVPEEHSPVYGHRDIKSILLDITRDSGYVDRILVLFQPGTLEEGTEITEGQRLIVMGQLQTYRDYSTGHVAVFVWASQITKAHDQVPEQNGINIIGTITREPNYRTTPKGTEITEVIVSVPSVFAEGYSCRLPVITWSNNARTVKDWKVGDIIELTGRLQSREYTKKKEDGSREQLTTYEISAARVEMKEEYIACEE